MLTTLISAACLAYSATANPLPPNAASILPSRFSLAPLHTPPPPPGPSSSFSPYDTDSHIIRDSYLVVLEDHLAGHEIEDHHSQVEALHEADSRINLLKADDADSTSSRQTRKHHGVKHKFHIGGNKHGHRRNAHKSKQLKGYSGHFSESTLDAIRAMKGVKYVERDSLVYATELEKMAPWVSVCLPPLTPLLPLSIFAYLFFPISGSRSYFSSKHSHSRYFQQVRVRECSWRRSRRLRYRHVSLLSFFFPTLGSEEG